MAWIEAPAMTAKAAGNSDSPRATATAPVLDSTRHLVAMSEDRARRERIHAEAIGGAVARRRRTPT
jgi:hypothetical protein